MNLSGVYTALITPFNSDGSFDEEGFCKLLALQIEANVQGIVILGTTGETPALTSEEKEKIIKLARSLIHENIQLIVGTGTYSTETTIKETLLAETLGADAALIVTPYYNRPTQEGLFLHYQAIANASDLPIVVYNIAGRTGVNLQTSTLKKLTSIPSIIGVKEASGNISQMMEVIEMRNQERPDFRILSGDDNLTLPLMSLGGEGVISVLSNLIPDLMLDLYKACKQGNFETARRLHYRLLPLFRGAFIETNPIPIKTLMAFSDLPAGPCRLPLSAPLPENEKYLRHLHETLKLSLLT